MICNVKIDHYHDQDIEQFYHPFIDIPSPIPKPQQLLICSPSLQLFENVM